MLDYKKRIIVTRCPLSQCQCRLREILPAEIKPSPTHDMMVQILYVS